MNSPSIPQKLVDSDEVAQPLLTSFGYLSRRLHLHSVQQYAALLGERLQFTQYVFLQLISHHPGETQGALALAAGLDRTTVVPIIESMLRRGWISRVRRRDNRRAYSIRLTPEGYALAREARETVQRTDEAMLSVLAPEDRQLLLDLLERVVVELTHQI